MNYVQVFKSQTGWNVRYVSGPRVSLIRSIFGTDVLPLPYALDFSIEQATRHFVKNTRNARVLSADAVKYYVVPDARGLNHEGWAVIL